MTLSIPDRAGSGAIMASPPYPEAPGGRARTVFPLVTGWRRMRLTGPSRAIDAGPAPIADTVCTALAAVVERRATLADLDTEIEAGGAEIIAPPWSSRSGGLALAAAMAAAMPGGWAVAASVTDGAAAGFLAAGLAAYLVATARTAGRLGRSTLAGRSCRVGRGSLATLALGQAGLVASLPAMVGAAPGWTVLGVAGLGLALAAGALTTAGDPYAARLLEDRAAAARDLASAERHAQTLLDRARRRLADELSRLDDQRAALEAEAKGSGRDGTAADQSLSRPRWRVVVARLTTLVT